jgi:hypothetical protein
VSSWKRPVALIAGVTMLVEILMALSGTGPEVLLVAALTGMVGVTVWLAVDLGGAAIGSSGSAAAPAPEPTARPDRRVTRLRSGLAYGRADGVTLDNLRLSLIELVDDQLRAVHRVDRSEDADAARAVIGSELDVFVNDPDAAATLLQPRSLDRILTLIERL